jgi:hypothetical protein
MNFRRAGMLKNRLRASITVPGAPPASRTSRTFPPSTAISVPLRSSARRVIMRNFATLAMLGTASPRKPRVITVERSAAVRSLLVAWRSKESSASSRAMPQPSSATRIRPTPPRSISTITAFAPASRLFSTSSFTTLAGRSTTSPAATWLARISGKTFTKGMAAFCER